MTEPRYLVVGLARVRSPWFRRVGQWAGASQLPLEFGKCVSAKEVRARLEGDRVVSAVLADAGAAGVDRALIDDVRRTGAAVIIVEEPEDAGTRRWNDLGATATLPSDFQQLDLVDILTAHALPVARPAPTTVPSCQGAATASESSWRGRLVAVTGGSGVGSSTVAMALAQGFGQLPGNERSVALADLAHVGDLAMYHHIGDVVPGLQELVEAHAHRRPGRAEIHQSLFEIEQRGYSLLLGLRRSRDWAALTPRLRDATIESLRSSFRIVVGDIDPEFDGESETGSSDIEIRNGPSRAAALDADMVVVCGDPTLRGLRSVMTIERDLIDLGVAAPRILVVINRAPRSPRARSEIAGALAELTQRRHVLGPVFLPDRRQLDVTTIVAGPLPGPLVNPMVRAVAAFLEHRPD